MDAVLDPPQIESPQPSATTQRIPHFNKQNAREYQRKAVEARQHNIIAEKVAKENEKLGLANQPRIALVEVELARVCKMMSDEEDANAYSKLASARKTLFNEWQVLSGTPNPGSAKSRVKRSTGHSVEPLTMSVIEPVANQPILSNAETVTVKLTDLQAMIDAAVAKALAGKV